jgi:subtilisin family serine protease
MKGDFQMASAPKRYILAPVQGFQVSDDSPQEMNLFADLQAMSTKREIRSLSASLGREIPLKVIDSIGETKPKLIECSPDDLPALRASHPFMRILPVVYYQTALKPKEQVREAAGLAAGAGVGAAVVAAAPAISLQVVSGATGNAVAGATIVAFTDFASRAGSQGVTDANGRVTLSLGGASANIERLYSYPPTDPGTGLWPSLQQNLVLNDGDIIRLLPVDLSYVDCVRYFYSANDLTLGVGVTVGVVDAGIALDHPDLVVSGGQNTVTGENPTDFGDNGTEGHGTHVAGIIAARGTPPNGIRGIAPGVTLRSYRVFGQGATGASNYDIAKAIDAGIADGCTILNLSLGSPATAGSDPGLADAITAAHNAGVLVYVANGNDGRQPVGFPASATFSQAISSTGRKGTFPDGTEPAGDVAAPFGADTANFIAAFSNIGPETDFTGPGVGVISTLPGGYGVMSGTSMATPAEVGAAARVLSAQSAILALPADASRTAAMLAAIAARTQPLGFGATFEGKGMID